MTAPQHGFLYRFFRGLWRALDFSRRAVLNLVFVLILLVLFAGLASNAPRLEPRSVLVIAPRGAIVEQYTSDAGDRAIARLTGDELNETQLRDLLAALDAAATDPHIERVLLLPDQVGSAGGATLQEFGAALDRFRQSGKEVIAYGDAFDQRGYALATHADRIYLHPEGAVLLSGLARYRTYFKDAFEKLGVEPRLFRVGEFKSAGEPYIRNDASDEAKEADLYWMNDVWQRYLGDVAQARKLDAGAIAKGIDTLVEDVAGAGGDLAQLALKGGLVDELKTRDQVREILMQKGVVDDAHHTFRHVDLDQYLAIVRAREVFKSGGAQVAVVVAQGEIMSGDQPAGQIGGDSTSRLIRKAREDEAVKALVLRVDSPGGEVFPSELIRREVELTRAAGKPVVASMGDLAASGGYWISMNADQIIASPSTITGSIGIYGLWFSFPETMSKLGLSTDGVGTTWIAGAFDPTRAFDARVGSLIQSVINRGYDQFIGRVAQARDKSPEEIDKVARGRVWTGAQALERGLVDRLGLLPDAIGEAAKRAGLDDQYRVRYVEKEPTAFENFLDSLGRNAAVAAMREGGVNLPAAWLPGRTRDELADLKALVARAAAQKPVAMFALCECGMR